MPGSKWADPGVVCDRIGASPYQPFPALLLSNTGTAKGLVHGSLSQRIFYHNHLVAHETGTIRWDILSSLKGVGWLDWPAGACLDDRWYLGVTRRADDIEQVFADYVTVLRRHLPPLYGTQSPNRHAIVWGSWNDGIGIDFDQDRLFKMAEFIKSNLPTVEWMQVDDGYGTHGYEAGSGYGPHGLGVPYEGAEGVLARKFPGGFRAFTDGIRERGLRPGLWVGGIVPKKAPLYREHPDWFVDYSYRITECGVLDISRPEVRAYMLEALDFFVVKGGFEAIKHDFWSYVFEDSHALLSSGERSGYQWRDWWLCEIRRRLPHHGYLQTGCDIVMGNPFLAEFFSNYRYGIDVGSGNWDYFRTNILWATACMALHTGDLFPPNSDAIGLFPGLVSDTEALTVINFCLISRSLVEIAGWLYQHPGHPRLDWVRKAICCPNNGQDVFFAGYDYRQPGSAGPVIWYLRTPHFSLLEKCPRLPLRTVAVFNAEDQPGTFHLDSGLIGLPPAAYVATDVWSLETRPLDDFDRFEIPPHGSRLLAISPARGGQQVLDADLKVVACADTAEGGVEIHLAHPGELELILSRRPRAVWFKGQAMAADVSRGNGNWLVKARLPDAGILELR